jgi:hypothetical protein
LKVKSGKEERGKEGKKPNHKVWSGFRNRGKKRDRYFPAGVAAVSVCPAVEEEGAAGVGEALEAGVLGAAVAWCSAAADGVAELEAEGFCSAGAVSD